MWMAFASKAAAQLAVNEFSQGASGNKEYLELVVLGTRSCNDSCADIRGWLFDDNNGWYGNTAISPGCYRFKDDPAWSCVPYGSLIVIYNSGDINASLPPADPTDANNDKVYVLPITSPLLEMHNTIPSGSSMTYPSSGFGAATTWTNLALNNSNDAVQVIDPANLGSAYHAVSYGSGVVAPVHISSSGSQKVYYLGNDQYNLSAAWVAGNVPANETPGMPNTPANAAWISGMLNGAAGGTSSNDTFAITICQGDSVFFHNTYYYSSGFYTAAYTSAAGCDSLVTLNLSVNPIPPPPQVVSPLQYCQNDASAALTATGANLLWYDSAAGGTGTGAAPVPATGFPGSRMYYVSQTVQGCESARDSIQVDITPQPAPPQAPPSIVVCQGAPAFSLSAQGQNIRWYSQPAGGAGTDIAPLIQTNTGLSVTWYVTQTVNGCESQRIPVEVRVSEARADFSLSADTLCISDSLLATNLSVGNNYINHWDFGDGFSYVQLHQAHRYAQPGQYTITLAITNTDGCTDTARKSVWVSPLPEVEVEIDKYHLCQGDEARFTLGYPQGFTLLAWDFGDGYALQQDDRDPAAGRGGRASLTLSHSYDEAGLYFITTTAYTPGCGSRTRRDSVTVYAMPQVDLGPDTSLCLHGAPFVLKNRFAAPEDARYEWSTGEHSREITVKHHGDISLTLYTPYCSNSGTVHIAKDCYIDIPNAFTPNNDGYNDYFFPRQELSASVTFFRMQVLNRWGQVVFETSRADGRGWDGRFNGKDQPGGVYIYMIKVEFANGAEESYQGNVTLLR